MLCSIPLMLRQFTECSWVKMILCALTLGIHVCVVNQMTDTHSQALGNIKKCLNWMPKVPFFNYNVYVS